MTKPLIYNYTSPFRRNVIKIDLSTGFALGITGPSLGKLLGVFCDDLACFSYFLSPKNQIVEFELTRSWAVEHDIFIKDDVLEFRNSGVSLSINSLENIFEKANDFYIERWGANVSGWKWLSLIVMFANFEISDLLDWHCEVVAGRATLQAGEFLPLATLKRGSFLRDAIIPPKAGCLKAKLIEEVEGECDMELS